MPKRKPKTDAARARALLDKGLAPTAVARKLGTTRQAVHNADARRKPIGRPAELERRRVTISVSPRTDAWLRAEAARDGCSLGEVIEGARLAIQAADSGEDRALERQLERYAAAEMLGDPAFRLQIQAAALYADARSMRESFPELAIGHAERAAALSMAARVLLMHELSNDFDLCAVRAHATRRIPERDQQYNAVIARTDSLLQRTAANHESAARTPTLTSYPPDYHLERAADLRAKYGDPDQEDPHV